MVSHRSGRSLYMGKVGGCKQEYKMDINSGSKHSSKEKTWSYSNTYGHHIAITHVANKMITIIWYMLVNKKLYNELEVLCCTINYVMHGTPLTIRQFNLRLIIILVWLTGLPTMKL